GRCGDVLADYARRDVSGMRVFRKRVGWARQAVTVLLVVTAMWALLLLRIDYQHSPAPEPVSCPAEGGVMQGDTLWDIARTCWPGAHTGQMVYEIRRLNPSLDPGRLRVGQVLRLPVATEIVGGAK